MKARMAVGAMMMAIVMSLAAFSARADTVADWADITTQIATDGPNTIRTIALAESSVYEAVNAITRRYPRDLVNLGPTDGASIDAAIAAASHAVLLHEALSLRTQIESAYQKMLAKIPEDTASRKGIAVGERAAADVLAKHTDDIGKIEPYRPLTSPGVYVPTTFPLGYAVAQHKPWFLKSASQFRPGPPPALKSDLWARDYNELKSIGALNSTTRDSEQTNIGRFWATALPDVHVGVVSSLARAPGREITRNARLFAAVLGALNDTEIAVFEAKYHYQFWRPITAIRNGDQDGNPATDRDADWTPLIVTPIQPEYPCAHCMVASTIATLIRADIGKEPLPTLSTTSNTLQGVTRHWTTTEDLVKEVSLGRMYCGVHYRNSTEVGNRMGEEVGTVVAKAYGML
ncbi:MAG TPA: vanadium-dependent haloperoxidase [Steroidobacteraceae bacterium]|nr:vanadium-dependent haloperoxidase [Steroidobacteraceae bacterium]